MRTLKALLLSTLLCLSSVGFSHGHCKALSREQSISLLSLVSAFEPITPALPEPMGAYRVGTAIFHVTDTSRADLVTKKPGQFRELMFQVWYPADITSQKDLAPYIPNPALLQALKAEQHDGQDPAVFDSWKDISTRATLNAPLSGKRAKFPLLFLSHGLGESRSTYTALAQELASQGYIVVCIDHPYGGITILPDGRVLSANDDPDAGNDTATPRQVEAWAKDAPFVLDRLLLRRSLQSGADSAELGRFARYIDSARIGMLGHSLGGAAALEACRTDARFKACADLDGAPFGKVTEVGVKRPTLIMRSGPIYSDEDLAKRGRTREQWEKMGREGHAMWNSLFAKSKHVPIYSVKINGAGHMSYSDAPFVMPDTITRFGGQIIDARRGFEIMTNYIRDFFGEYFYGKRSTLLHGDQSPYMEVSAERFNMQVIR